MQPVKDEVIEQQAADVFERLRAAYVSSNLSLTDISELCDYPRPNLSRLFRGQINCDVETLQVVCRALGLSTAKVINGRNKRGAERLCSEVISYNLRKLIGERSQKEVAIAAGLSEAYICRRLQDSRRTPHESKGGISIRTLLRLAYALRVNAARLATETL